MAIFQTNAWVCEICGHTVSTTELVSPYDDPVVVPPGDTEWEYDDEDRLMCPDCLVKSISKP
jgi:hypothetical protein